MADYKSGVKVIFVLICFIMNALTTPPLQGLMDIALLSANANQLRTALELPCEPFRTVLVILLSLSILLQVTPCLKGASPHLPVSRSWPPACSGWIGGPAGRTRSTTAAGTVQHCTAHWAIRSYYRAIYTAKCTSNTKARFTGGGPEPSFRSSLRT